MIPKNCRTCLITHYVGFLSCTSISVFLYDRINPSDNVTLSLCSHQESLWGAAVCSPDPSPRRSSPPTFRTSSAGSLQWIQPAPPWAHLPLSSHSPPSWGPTWPAHKEELGSGNSYNDGRSFNMTCTKFCTSIGVCSKESHYAMWIHVSLYLNHIAYLYT